MAQASKKGSITLRVEDASKLEKFLTKISNDGHLNDRQKKKAHKYAALLTGAVKAASSRVSLPLKAILAALQCLAFSLEHCSSIKKWAEKLMGDE